MKTKQIFILCLLVAEQILVSAEDETDATEVVGMVGGSVTIKCDLPVSDPPNIAWSDNVWNQKHGQEPIFNSSISSDIVETHRFKENMEIDSDFSLILNNLLSGREEDNELEVSSAGDYFCHSISDGQKLSQKFNLVLAEAPTCTGETEVTEGESTELTCSVMYSGKVPTLEWFRNGQKEDVKAPPSLGKVESVLDVSDTTYLDDEAIYTCRMTIGDIHEECQQTLSVKYIVRDIKLVPMDDVIRLDQEIRCTARGNPQPKITFDPESSSAYSGKNFRAMEVEKAWLNQMTTVVCRAENEFEGKVEIIEKSITFNVTVPKSSPVAGGTSHNSVSILALVSTILAVLLATLL